MTAQTYLLMACFTVVLIYLIYWFRIAYNLASTICSYPKSEKLDLTLVCVFRNEEEVLSKFLDQCEQLISQSDLPICLVNDHSTDSSVDIIHSHPIYRTEKFQLIHLSDNELGKKAGIDCAVKHAESNYIYLTDADCKPEKSAIEILYAQLMKGSHDLALGWVKFRSQNHSFIESYQVAENSALVALSVHHASKEKHSMGNAANMIFNREKFISANPFKDNQHVAGGDDIFLIEAFKRYKLSISYSNNQQTAIETSTHQKWNVLWEQRIRWAAKTKYQQTQNTRNSQILLLLFFLFLGGYSAYLLSEHMYVWVVSIWGFKSLGEVLFLRKIIQAIGSDKIPVFHLFFLGILQFFFIPSIAIWQWVQPVSWKNRSYP